MSTPRQDPDRRLARLLDGFQPSARPEFREELRERFLRAVAEGLEAQAAQRQASGGDPSTLRGALDLFRPKARAEFEGDLRRRFLAQASQPSSAQLPRAGGGFLPRRLPVSVWAPLLAAAAALLLWVLWPERGATPSDGVAPPFVVRGAGFVAEGIRVDGELLPAGAGPEELARRLGKARTVTAGDEELLLAFDGQILIELAEHSRLDLVGLTHPEAVHPETGDVGPYVLASDGSPGAYRIATTERFHEVGRGLEFRCPSRYLEVTGTVFGVDVFGPQKVCVCCCEGVVRTFCPNGTTPEALVRPEGSVLTEGHELQRVTHLEEHQAPLRALRELRSSWPPVSRP